jgi:hypothetical protein
MELRFLERSSRAKGLEKHKDRGSRDSSKHICVGQENAACQLPNSVCSKLRVDAMPFHVSLESKGTVWKK